MYKQYFKQAIAGLRENPLVGFFTILGTVLAVATMMILVLTYQIKTASFAPVSERNRMLYINVIEGLNKDNVGYSGGGMGYNIVQQCFYKMTVPETVTAVTSNVTQKQTSVQGNKKIRQCDVRGTDANFWKVFDFHFINGISYTESMFASAMPVAVISDKVAREFFGTTEAAGRIIQLDYVDYKVLGVVASVSDAVSEAYGEIWAPYSLNEEAMEADFTEGIGGELQVCILAKSKSDFDAIRQEAQSRVATFNSGQKEFKANIWKQPITSIQRMFYYVQGDHLDGNFSGMLMLAALFLFLPIFNLLGIMFSQIKKRSPEIGLRKAFGATSTKIIGQLIIENFAITFIGSVIGVGVSILFLYMAKDSLLGYSDVKLHLSMILKPTLFVAAILVCLLINILSTILPAWRIAKAEIVESLNTEN
ncbi:ABC transporter permease [Dysgonomonas mossii]|uniref:ABC transporter permease n=1 Tax=Dysgonomonas mossii TaxID=163665 RepID=UPI00399158FA